MNDLKKELSEVKTPQDLDNIKSKWLGKKSEIRNRMDALKNLPDEDRKTEGVKINKDKEKIEHLIEETKADLTKKLIDAKLNTDNFDITLPGHGGNVGALNPVSIIEQKCIAAMRRLGFQVVVGPEIETAENCFDLLDVPPHHPARDLQDTFWIEDQKILPRTHTTSVQSRFMLSLNGDETKLPIRIVSPGKAYRNEAVDATHLAIFHQFEGLYVGVDVKMPELKGTLEFILREIYGAEIKIRFKPKFYPYTEPSIGADIFADGRWITIVGAGMVSPKVLQNFGFDPSRVSGFAFGFGTTRLASEFSGATPRELYGMDLRVHKRIKNEEQ
ncbi:MAG: phenylalanine--tRNA ligase subunit alpha [Rickettsiales bacterium]|jgi:phenylalanyl-tRNA synthetase alpha chain|nr:phenylalanine--tRNA ligase subunit alpha [Rickettsiales bacterium]